MHSGLSASLSVRNRVGWNAMAFSARTKKVSILSFVFALYLVLGTVIFVAIEDNDEGTSKEQQEVQLKLLKENITKKYNMSSADYDALFQNMRDSSEMNDTKREWSYEHGFSFVVQVVTTIGEFIEVNVSQYSMTFDSVANLPGVNNYACFGIEFYQAASFEALHCPYQTLFWSRVDCLV